MQCFGSGSRFLPDAIWVWNMSGTCFFMTKNCKKRFIVEKKLSVYEKDSSCFLPQTITFKLQKKLPALQREHSVI
jgi:hypothetical protein